MARVAKNRYYVNPIIREWLDKKNVSLSRFANAVPMVGSYLSKALQQDTPVGAAKREGIIDNLSIVMGREIGFDEVFSNKRHLIEET
ncbi:MAG: hypothetical protein QME49_07080 [bacterium]|nr:hypothetical protein [bacterium]